MSQWILIVLNYLNEWVGGVAQGQDHHQTVRMHFVEEGVVVLG